MRLWGTGRDSKETVTDTTAGHRPSSRPDPIILPTLGCHGHTIHRWVDLDLMERVRLIRRAAARLAGESIPSPVVIGRASRMDGMDYFYQFRAGTIVIHGKPYRHLSQSSLFTEEP